MFGSAKNTRLALVMTAAIVGAWSISAVPGTAYAQHHRGGDGWHGGGISTGAAVGLGLGAFALGSALGASSAYPSYGYAYSYPSYGGGYAAPYGYGYGY